MKVYEVACQGEMMGVYFGETPDDAIAACQEDVDASGFTPKMPVRHCLDGMTAVECIQDLSASDPEIVWAGDWTSSFDGSHETRAVVGESPKGFHPGFEVSHGGGDCDPSYREALPSFNAAKKAANLLEINWDKEDAADDFPSPSI